MSSSLKLPSIEVGDVAYNGSLLERDEDVDEEEDVDFNPFLRDSPSLEASSSLSSDVEVLDAVAAGQVQDYTLGDAELGEEIVTVKKRKAALISQPEVGTFHIAENFASCGTDVQNSTMTEDRTQSRIRIMDTDDEDAICKRTRARYSLASFTLDELETFLQETDDDDEPYNIDDEEEYKKFLAAVLQDGDDAFQIRQDNENVQDEDEETDADFELELEEALESDLEENCGGDTKGECGASRRPETRLNGCRKASSKEKSRLLGLVNKPLRPILPNTPIASFPTLTTETASRGLFTLGHGFLNGFTPHQRGQLHCLIHEHVQLLVQVFSLCVLDPCKQHIASQVKDLILETLQKRAQVALSRQASYPFFCFFPPHTHPSMQHGHTQTLTAPSTYKSDCPLAEPRECLQTGDPFVSVLDVAPLNLVGKYLDEVSVAVQKYQQHQIQSGSPSWLKNEPLFPFHESHSEVDVDITRGSAKDEPIKKTLAGALVERTKKQSVALVPKEIAELAQRFLPLFDPALFPHKPPPATVANRVLFTDAEDELLALGLMEYNTDWKAIQQRFLPCKSKHQIFVRQKNRSSAKAPENPIKMVRKMKSSPLTKEEIARVQEGLKVFKLDWMSVWRYVVPYRDPSLLPRQWRIANGTQKSYKLSEDKKEKRRLRDKNRRRGKPEALASGQTSSEKEECQTDNVGGENNRGDDCVGSEGEAYVHEAFLADWRPRTSSPAPPSVPLPSLTEKSRPPCGFSLLSGSRVIEQTNNSAVSDPNLSASWSTSRPGEPHLAPRPYQSRRGKNARVVRLAPGLPPVNLPASVRVMSQSAFQCLGKGKEFQFKSSFKRSCSNQPPGESPALNDKRVEKDKNQSDLQMHPLLFQPSGDRHLLYYPSSCGNSTFSSFNFISPFQPQMNLNLLGNPHRADQVANHIDKFSRETTSAVGIDFHPLLQKANEETLLPTNLEPLRSSSAQPYTKSSNVNERAKELDLDIHLSLSRQEFATASKDVNHHCVDHSPSALGHYVDHSPSALGQNRICNNLGSGVQPLGLSSGAVSVDGSNFGGQSLPGIVMEHEELSDSEEEIGEHVQFECEEMDDSEGDEE